jgi:hypothetical protein
MALSRALKDVMRGENGMAKKSGNREHHADGDSVGKDKWMQDVHPKKGALHRELGIPEGKKIATSSLEKATHAKSSLERKRANLALRYRGD